MHFKSKQDHTKLQAVLHDSLTIMYEWLQQKRKIFWKWISSREKCKPI